MSKTETHLHIDNDRQHTLVLFLLKQPRQKENPGWVCKELLHFTKVDQTIPGIYSSSVIKTQRSYESHTWLLSIKQSVFIELYLLHKCFDL